MVKKRKKRQINQYLKPRKNNLPKNHETPTGLKTMLNSIKSELMDPQNRNKDSCNIPQEEVIALKELIRLQKERVITIKAADKGAGIVILDFQDYMRSCYEHLLSNVPSQSKEEEPQMYYKACDECAAERAKTKIICVLKEALENNTITTEEYSIMNPEEKARFYCNLKVHKQSEHN